MKKKVGEELIFKVITIGDSGVGKTAIIRRYIYNDFEEKAMSTIGVSFGFKEVILKNGKVVKLKLIDTAGQEKYSSLAKSYYKNVDGVLFVFDFNNLESFENIENWIRKFEENNNHQGIPKYLIGNKNDLEKKIEKKLIDDFIDKYNYKFEECSVLNNINIDNILQDISEKMYENFYTHTHKEQKNITIKKYGEKRNRNECNCISFSNENVSNR